MSFKKNILTAIAASFILVFSFQNCTPTKFSDSSEESMFSSLDAGQVIINNNAEFTNKTDVLVQIKSINAVDMYVTNDPTCNSGGTWQPISTEIAWKLSEKNINTRVYAKFRSMYKAETPCIDDNIIHDDLPPIVTMTNALPKVTNGSNTELKFNINDTGSGVEKFHCPPEMSNCSTDLSVSNSQEGLQNLNFYATDKAGNKSLPMTASWIYDKTGPVISFNMTPATLTNNPSAKFKVDGLDNYSAKDKITYKVSINNSEFKAEPAEFNYDVIPGTHVVKVVAYDEAMNPSNEITYSWKYGNKVPGIGFTETPKPYTNIKGQIGFNGYDQFGQALTKFECSLNNASFTNCTSPQVFTDLPQGANSFRVRGTDSLGMVSGILEYKWSYDTVAPVLSFITKPVQFSKNLSELIKVSSVEAVGLEYIEFFLDETSINKALTDSVSLANLKEGLHKVRVQAKDLAGNVSPSIETSFYSDFTGPVVDPFQIAPYLKNNTLSTPISAKDNINDPANTIELFYQLNNTGNFTKFTSPLILNNLVNGTHQFKVYALDKAGNQSAIVVSSQFVIDLIAPVISLVTPIPSITNASNTNIKLEITENGSGFDKLECPPAILNCSLDMIIPNTAEGKRSFDFYATDKAGNRSAPLTVGWTYDKTGPVISFTSTPASQTNLLTAAFKIQATDNFSALSKIKFKHSLNNAAFVDSTDTINLNVLAGANNLKVVAYDEAQNKSNEISYTWSVGTTIPNVKFTETPKAYSNIKGQFAFSGTDQFGQPVVKYECSLNNASFTVCTSPFLLTNVVVGNNSFKVRVTDNLGLMSGELEYKWVYDVTGPVLSFVSKPAQFSKNPTENVKVLATDANGLEYIEFFLDNTSVTKSLADSASLANLQEGLHTIKVQAKDLAGNMSNSIEATFYSDFTGPVLNPMSIPNFTKTTSLSIPVSAIDNIVDPANNLKYFYQLDNAATFTEFSSPLALASLSEGEHQFKVYALDQAGNQSVVVTAKKFVVDTAGPVITFVKQPASTIGSPSKQTLNFTVVDAGSGVANYQCALTLGGTAISTPCTAANDFLLTITTPGNYSFKVTATDNLGTANNLTVNWTAEQSYITKNTNFSVTSSTNNKVDILLVIDNSGSMAGEQEKLASAFSNFINNLAGLDWRIAITTTDVSGNTSAGKIKKLGNTNSSPYFIQPSTPSALNVLQQYIIVGTDGDGSEKGLTAIHKFIDLAKTSSSKEYTFYRPDAVLSTVVVTDSDEAAYTTNYETAEAFLNGSSGLLAKISNKPYVHHSSIIIPDDSACLGSGEDYGTTYFNVSNLTGGISASICSENYGDQLNKFASTIVNKISSQTLDCSPVDANADGKIDVSVSYVTTSNPTSQIMSPTEYTITNNVLKFNNAVDITGTYTITYSCLATLP